MQQLSIKLLGRPEVLLDGQVTKFPTRKALALLVYLVVTRTTHSRERLMALLWPDSVTASAQASLRNTLARLRTTLGDASSILIVTADAIGLDPSADFELDLQAVSAAVSALRDTSLLPSPGLLQCAIAVSRGEFLAEFDLHDAPAFDHWELIQREQWHRQFALVLARLAQTYLTHRDLPEAIATGNRWIQHDPLDEAAYRCLMLSHSLAGDRSAALQAYRSCSAILAAELDLKPDPATTQLAKIIRQGTPGLQPRARRAPPTARSPLRLPLVGRVDQFASLVAAYADAAGGAPHAVVIFGAPGMGKTRLVGEFLDWAGLQGADVLRGQAFEAGAQSLYQPIITALRQRLERENAPEDLLADVWLAELSGLLPELLERYPDLGPAGVRGTGNATAAAGRLFEAVARLGAALSRRRPLVFFLDDWQWADAGSFDLVQYLSRTWAENQAPILLVLTIGIEDLATHAGLAQWLASLERFGSVSYAWLYRLSLADVRACVEAWAGSESNPAEAIRALSGRLYRETEGVPFFLVETLKLLIEQTEATREEGGIDLAAVLTKLEAGVTMPRTVRQAILTRLGRFDTSAGELLAAATVLGRNFHYAELCQISGVDELAGLAALDALLAGEIFIETSDARRPYDFAHDKIREVVYDEAGPARRHVLHKRALAALEQAAAPPAELAYHAERAELGEKARHYLQLAGNAVHTTVSVPDTLLMGLR